MNLRWLRRLAATLLQDLLAAQSYDLGIYLVSAAEVTRLNETFLRHKGPTDVITFDYTERAGRADRRRPRLLRRDRRGACPALLHGEIFVCVDEAVSQARRFRTTWQRELVRYVVHGLLHLLGHDDQHPAARRRMKREEDRLLRRLAGRFDLALFAKPGPRQRG